MNREFKFRAYSNYSKKMYTPVAIEWGENGILDVVVYDPEITKNLPEDSMAKIAGDNNDRYRLIDYVLMQYTGLVDKNGVEIYEGDIVKREPVNKQAAGGGNYIIKFNDGYSMLGLYSIEYNHFDLDYSRRFYKIIPKKIEVIGNIYENPELLK